MRNNQVIDLAIHYMKVGFFVEINADTKVNE